jgi:hypothetical protein
MPQQHLLNNAVFDRSGSPIGNVVNIQPSTAEGFTLIVQLLEPESGDNQVTIPHTSIQNIDLASKTIHVDLDRQQLTPQASQNIQLVEERLVVNRQRFKVGEVSVRRVVETETVEVPVQLQREKLVVEKIGDDADPIEIPLGKTQIEGYEVTAQSADIDGNQDLTASGSFDTIRDAIAFLNTVAERPGHPCEKVRIAILLDGDNGLKGTLYEFKTPQTASQKISRLDKILLSQCNQVRLELFLNDPSLKPTYQDLIAQYTSH